MTRIEQLATPAPLAEQKPNERQYHGKTLSDPYFWLKDPDYPRADDEDVLDYLKAENTYYQEFLEPHKPWSIKFSKGLKAEPTKPRSPCLMF